MSEKHLQRGFVILFLLLAVVVRLTILNWELPYYSVDENDVVEPALAFLSGDWEPHWYGYGPLFSYLLAFIYKIWMWISAFPLGWTDGDFYYAAFFEPTPLYVVARAFHAFIVLGVAGVSWLFARRYFDSQTSVVALILGLAPFLDINTNFTIRIDTLLGLVSLLSIFFAAQFGQDRMKLRPYIMSGIFAGFGIATKNLTGLLVLPVIVFAHFLSVWQTTNFPANKKIGFAIIQPGLWVFLCSVIIGHTLANPYSIINSDGFLLEVYNGFVKQSGEGQLFSFYESPYDFRWLVSIWGLPMVVVVILALIASLRRPDKASLILLVYIAVFVSAFIPFTAQNYWYNAVFPAVILIVARFVSGVSQSVVKYLLNLLKKDPRNINYDAHMRRLSFAVMILITIGLTFSPYWKTGLRVYSNWFSPVAPQEKRADYAAQSWIENNLPAHSTILLIGRHALNLPRLIADKARVQAVWGEYFSYHRDEYPHWDKAFENAYSRLDQNNKPTYRLLNIRERYSIAPEDLKKNSFYRSNLALIAHDKGCKYVVIASPKGYKGKWEENPSAKLLAFFNKSTGHKGDEVKIFEVLL